MTRLAPSCGPALRLWEAQTSENDVYVGDAPYAVIGRALKISNVTITGSGQFGVDAWTSSGPSLRITSSTVTGSGTASYCGDYPCSDLFGARRPRLVATTCDTNVAPSASGGT